MLANALTGETAEREGVDTVLVASHHRPRREPFEALKGRVLELHAIGDCLAPRLALDAIHDARPGPVGTPCPSRPGRAGPWALPPGRYHSGAEIHGEAAAGAPLPTWKTMC